MVLVTSNKARRLLYISYIGRVRPADFTRQQPDMEALMAELPPDFRVLANFSELEAMDLECMVEIGRTMELVDRSGVGLIVRVLPDPAKDIGLNIFSIFHYPHRPQIATCRSTMEAIELLGL
jgi:hypothetical protein